MKPGSLLRTKKRCGFRRWPRNMNAAPIYVWLEADELLVVVAHEALHERGLHRVVCVCRFGLVYKMNSEASRLSLEVLSEGR